VDKPKGEFVPLSSVRGNPRDPKDIVAEIREIYFKTTSKTIHEDFAHAIALLKALPDEQSRGKAHVYMEGLAEMRKEWAGKSDGKKSTVKSSKSKVSRKI
jgi:hypothetical protein